MKRFDFLDNHNQSPAEFEEFMRTEEAASRPAAAYATGWSADSPSVYLPTGYERNYAYPVIIWLTDGSHTASEFHERMEAISDRNYVGIEISVRDLSLSRDSSASQTLLQRIEQAVAAVRQFANLHSERIYLAGIGPLATEALQLTLIFPLHFAGFLALQPQSPPLERPLANFRKFRHLRGLIVAGDASDPASQLHSLKSYATVLHNAGIKIHWNSQKSALNQKTYSLINRFIMQAIWGDQFVTF